MSIDQKDNYLELEDGENDLNKNEQQESVDAKSKQVSELRTQILEEIQKMTDTKIPEETLHTILVNLKQEMLLSMEQQHLYLQNIQEALNSIQSLLPLLEVDSQKDELIKSLLTKTDVLQDKVEQTKTTFLSQVSDLEGEVSLLKETVPTIRERMDFSNQTQELVNFELRHSNNIHLIRLNPQHAHSLSIAYYSILDQLENLRLEKQKQLDILGEALALSMGRKINKTLRYFSPVIRKDIPYRLVR